MEKIIEINCPKCKEKFLADLDIDKMVKVEMQRLIDKMQEVTTPKVREFNSSKIEKRLKSLEAMRK